MRYFYFLLPLFTLLLQAAPQENLEKVTLQLHWKYQFEFAGFIAAKEKGFYRDAGLDVDLKEYDFGIDIEKDILDGKSEYGIYNSLSLLEYLRGKPLVLVSSYFKRAALVLVTTPDIKTPKDLEGKRVMASTKEDFILNFKAYFDGYDVDIDKINLVAHSYDIKEFQENQISAMTAFISHQPYVLDEAGVSYNILDPSQDNLFVLQLELITSKNEALFHSQRVKKFQKASLKGWEYALSHKEELVDIIYNKYSQAISKKALLHEAKAIEKLILPYTYNIGSIDRNFLNKQIKLFKEYYHVGMKKNLDNFIFDDIDKSRKIMLTQKELEYIQNKKSVSVCLQYDQFPIDGFENGKFTGIMSDIYALLSKKTSLVFEPVPSKSVEDLKEKILQKECDILSVYPTLTDEYPVLRATEPFFSTHFTVVTKLNKSFASYAKQLQGKTLLTSSDFYKRYLLELYPHLNIKVVHDREKMMKILLKEKAYGVITLDEQADYLIDKYGYGSLKVNGFLAKDDPISASIGVQKELPLLFSIVQKSLKEISPEKFRDIANSWRMTRYHSVTDYTFAFVIGAFMFLVLLIMTYYQKKLKSFNKALEAQVGEKTRALREINDYLEETVAQKIEELISKDELLTSQSKQAVMGEMISMIAHQWRQPLNTITLNISNLQIKTMMGEQIDPAVLQKTLDEISETIIYLSETIDDFKTYFHPDKEKVEVDIEEILLKSIGFVQARAKAEQVTIEVDVITPLRCEVYQNELIQVLLNLLNNAIDAYANVDLDAKVIKLSAKEEEGMLIIAVHDNAGGIKDVHLSKLFEPYFSTKGKNGTGLGLYMSKMIIEKQFNGEIQVVSENGESTFSIVIPKVQNV